MCVCVRACACVCVCVCACACVVCVFVVVLSLFPSPNMTKCFVSVRAKRCAIVGNTRLSFFIFIF